MKIQCDVCEKEEASVFCTADEAALCDGCNHLVHHANKIASKHPRFSLLHPPAQHYPRCDICQERRANVFCKEDRAILCRECDLQIHKANQHTQMHNRFLLTGVKLSCTSVALYQSCSSLSASASNNNALGYDSSATSGHVSRQHSEPAAATSTSQEGSGTSSISEYLIQTIPGWQVEEFLDPFSSPYGFCN